jgi:hypothetical protein
MFEIVCELANTSGKTLTIESSIPEAVKPDVQILKSGQQLGVFASQTRSTVKITVVSVEADARIEQLEAALREIAADYETEWSTSTMVNMLDVAQILSERINIARKALNTSAEPVNKTEKT